MAWALQTGPDLRTRWHPLRLHLVLDRENRKVPLQFRDLAIAHFKCGPSPDGNSICPRPELVLRSVRTASPVVSYMMNIPLRGVEAERKGCQKNA